MAYALVELGDNTSYERCRENAIARFTSATNIDELTAERLLKVCLLRPADPGLIAALRPFAKIAAKSQTRAGGNTGPTRPSDGWTSVALGLLEYRCGNYQTAIDWCRHGVTVLTNPLLPSAPAHVILAMALQRVHEDEASRSELQSALRAGLDRARSDIQEEDWHDWEFGHILLQEATSMLADTSKAPNPTDR